MAVFEKRIKRYTNFEYRVIPDIKKAGSLSPIQLKEKEGEKLLATFGSNDYVVLLDEKGKQLTSVKFAEEIEKRQIAGTKQWFFVVGGAFGFSDAVYKRANAQLSLSKMTFSHQLIRLVFLEQLYRGFSILRNEPYHNE